MCNDLKVAKLRDCPPRFFQRMFMLWWKLWRRPSPRGLA